MDGYIKVDTTSEQQRLEELRFRISLYKVVEIVMNLAAFIMAMGGLLAVLSGLGGDFGLIGLIGAMFAVSGYFTRLTRKFAVSEVQAIKAAIEPVQRS